jgi:hypothetical protein
MYMLNPSMHALLQDSLVSARYSTGATTKDLCLEARPDRICVIVGIGHTIAVAEEWVLTHYAQ